MPFDVSIIINPTAKHPSKEISLIKLQFLKVLSSVVDLMPQSYREQSKRLLTHLAENEHVQIDDESFYCNTNKT